VRRLEDRLDSWKEIAAYLSRDMTTVQRWEKREGMPVHRHQHDQMGSVYAFSSELDAWVQSRRLRLEQEQKEQERSAETPLASAGDHGPRGVPRASRWLVVGGVAVLSMLAVTSIISRIRSGNATRPKITSLAVLPLKNLSGDATQEYFADGMTESVIGRLSMIRGLRVISRTSVMQFKDTHMSAPEIAKKLQVDALVEGSVIRQGGRVRVHAQLIRGATDEHFWSETYDRELGDALVLESSVAQAIAQRVQVTFTGDERARLAATRSVAPEVYESYLKGAFGKNNSRTDIETSIGYFEEAIRKDPTFAPAYVGLAFAYDDLGTLLVGASHEEVRPKAISAARKALELDPDLADAHALLAELQQDQWQWAEAQAEYQRALELNPNDAAAHLGLANWLLCQGQTEEALVWSRRGSLMLRPACSPSRHATLSIESSDSFVASAAVSIATGWSEPVPGREFHPLKSSAFHGALFRQPSLSYVRDHRLMLTAVAW
jgi:TolB-like protein